jgi:exopolyphosphatase/guanosine-5'-triphosphate,3'-diphosphate pyrophosphatase
MRPSGRRKNFTNTIKTYNIKNRLNMSKVQFAAIDIGSNAVRLLIKSASTEDTEDKLQKLLMVRVPLRLGQESFVNGKIS